MGFELICQGCNGTFSPGGSPAEISVVDDTNPHYVAAGPVYFTPSDTSGEGTPSKPFATLDRALAEAGRIVDSAVIIRLHNSFYDPANPTLRGILSDKTIEEGEWDINPVGGKGKLFIVGDMIMGEDAIKNGVGTGGTMAGPPIMIDKLGMIEGAIAIDVFDGPLPAGGWGANDYTPSQDPNIHHSWLEWVELIALLPQTFRFKILAIDTVTTPGTTRFYLQLPKRASNFLPSFIPIPGSVSVVAPGYGFQNPAAVTDQLTVWHMFGASTGRMVYEPPTLLHGEFFNMPNIVLHGISIENTGTALNVVAITGGNFIHGMLTLSAINQLFTDGIVSAENFVTALSAVDDAWQCGGTLYMITQDNKGVVQFGGASGFLNFAMFPVKGHNGISFGASCEMEISNLNLVLAHGSVDTWKHIRLESSANLRITGSFHIGQKLEVDDNGKIRYYGWNSGPSETGMALAGAPAGDIGRIEIMNGGSLDIEESFLHLDQVAIVDGGLGLDAGYDPFGLGGGGLSEDCLVFIDECSRIKVYDHGKIDAVSMRDPAAAAGYELLVPFLINKNKFINQGQVKASLVTGVLGDDFGAGAAVRGQRGSETIILGDTSPVFEIQNENVAAVDVFGINGRSLLMVDLFNLVQNIAGAVAGNILIGATSKPFPVGAATLNEFTAAGALTAAEDTSLLVTV